MSFPLHRHAAAAMSVSLIIIAGTAHAQRDSAGAAQAFDRGRAAHRNRQVHEAVRQFEQAVTLDSMNAVCHTWLGHGYSRQLGSVNFLRKASAGRKAGQEYARAVALDPGSVEAAEARLDFLLEAPGIVGGNVEKARAEAARIGTLSAYTLLDERLARDSNEQSSLYSLGRISSISGERLSDGAAALRRFLRVPDVDTLSQANAHYRLGLIAEKNGDVVAARAEYHPAMTLVPRHALSEAALARLDRR